ncbi:MAG TPA: class I SAM-dependent methyltransferase, partial [Thermohalobaculum sp.]|nr:class I SAM-dependent methyltransferase [Thermohalobaculum sp.]
YVGVDPQPRCAQGFGSDLTQHGTAEMILKRSTDAVGDVGERMPAGIDLLLIDGCHCEACASADWNDYGPMVRPGGYAMFHDIAEARQRAYAAVDCIDWPEGFCRTDIAWRALERE